DPKTEAPQIAKPSEQRQVIADDDMHAQVKANMLAALEACNWKLFGEDGAAALLGLKPTTLASRIKRMGLKKT
ncbi:MAG TPA: Fis family transcriptional regulator, partial [Cellvibrionaceae bacterium]|nr:Fis family transcriptional regulator [Cellvibrionaceae bacterium]